MFYSPSTVCCMVCFIILLFVSQNWGQEAAGPPSKSDVAKEEAASLFEAYLSNMMAWEKGDLLIKQAESFDAFDGADNPGVVINSVTFSRLIFDHKKKRYLVIQSQETWGMVSGAEDKRLEHEVEKEGVKLEAFLISEGKSYTRFVPKKKDLIPEITRNELFRHFKVPELRLIVLVPFELGLIFEDRMDAVRQVSMNNIARVGPELNERQKVVISKEDAKNKVTIESRYTFDKLSFVPTQKTVWYVREGKKDIRASDFKAQWKEINGLFVPTASQKETPRRVSIGGEVKKTKHYSDMKVHWFSLNSEIDERFFEQSILDDQHELLHMTDPDLCAATDLMEHEETIEGSGNH